MTTPDNVLVTAAQICELYEVTPGRVRAWIAAGLIEPVHREGRGRSGTMYFSRGAVAGVIFAVCPACGSTYKRTTLKQGYCSRLCRDRGRRLAKRFPA